MPHPWYSLAASDVWIDMARGLLEVSAYVTLAILVIAAFNDW